jgi:hypothetical protein
MRVTKIIREYVEKTINSKLAYGAPKEEYEAASKKLNDLGTEINEKVEDYAAQLIAEAQPSLPEGFKLKLSNYGAVNWTSYGSPMYDKSQAHIDEVKKKRAAAIESILVELELGATKADLERLIAEAIA